MLQIKNLTKLFYDKKTKTYSGIGNISFDAKEGLVLGLIGANGAGKTTTMRIIAGFMKAQTGEILLDNKNTSSISNLHKIISFVSNETQIYDRLTGKEVLTLFGKLAGIEGKVIDNKIKELSERLEMSDFLDKQVGTYSTGMKQKINFARALITDPRVLIFDEITNGLDIFAAREVKNMILELKNDKRIILYSTHIMPDAKELCDDIVFIHKGKVLDSYDEDKLSKVIDLENLFFELVKREEEND